MEKITSELRAERGNSSRRSRNSSVTGSHIIRKLPEGACLTVRTYDVTGGTASKASSFYRTGLFYTIGKELPYRIKKPMDRTAAEWKMSLARPATQAIFDCRENPASGILCFKVLASGCADCVPARRDAQTFDWFPKGVEKRTAFQMPRKAAGKEVI